MPTQSAGILLFRERNGQVEVLLAHPGGPFWARKDIGAWSIPKGEHGHDEDPLSAARREFAEELGQEAPVGEGLPLGDILQKGGKRVSAWAFQGDFEVTTLQSNLFEMEWPPRSGKREQFPEIDRAAWLNLGEATSKINPAQSVFLDRLAALLRLRR